MRFHVFIATVLLGYVSVAHAVLGGRPTGFKAENITVAPSVTVVASNYTLRETTLPTGTLVREYVSDSGIVFAVSWKGPFLPDLRALLGKYFDTMTAESASRPRGGHSQLAVNRPEVVIFSGGHMRAFEGRAWVPAELPLGVTASDIQ